MPVRKSTKPAESTGSGAKSSNNAEVTTRGSKVQERLRAAELRRAELQRQKEEQSQQRLTARKERMNSRATHNKSQELPVASFSPPAIPQLYAADGTLLPGRCLQLPDGTRVPLVEGRRREASQRRRLFGISTVERLLQMGDTELATVVLGIMQRATSARHPIQHKFNMLTTRMRSVTMTASFESISSIASPHFATNMHDLRTPGSSLEVLHRDGDGLFSVAAIDEITQRHGLSPQKQTASHEHSDSRTRDVIRTVPVVRTRSAWADDVPRAHPSLHNFLTVLSPRKGPIKDLDASTVLTPLRKSARLALQSPVGPAYDEDSVASLLLQDENVAFVANPYIAGASARTPVKHVYRRKRARLSDSALELHRASRESSKEAQ